MRFHTNYIWYVSIFISNIFNRVCFFLDRKKVGKGVGWAGLRFQLLAASAFLQTLSPPNISSKHYLHLTLSPPNIISSKHYLHQTSVPPTISPPNIISTKHYIFQTFAPPTISPPNIGSPTISQQNIYTLLHQTSAPLTKNKCTPSNISTKKFAAPNFNKAFAFHQDTVERNFWQLWRYLSDSKQSLYNCVFQCSMLSNSLRCLYCAKITQCELLAQTHLERHCTPPSPDPATCRLQSPASVLFLTTIRDPTTIQSRDRSCVQLNAGLGL